MNTGIVKKSLYKLIGKNLTAQIHGLWFLYLTKSKPLPDPELEYISNLNLQGTIAIDVGANGANWTKGLSSLVEKSGRVLAFEAHPYYFKASAAAVSYSNVMKHNTTIYPYALSDNESTISLAIEENGKDLDGQSRIILNDQEGNTSLSSVKVESYRLDKFLKTISLDNRKISIVKLDVEGHESHVIRGAKETIKAHLPILICEFNSDEVGRLCFEEIRDELRPLGYNFYITDGKNLEYLNEVTQLDSHISRNVICMKQVNQ